MPHKAGVSVCVPVVKMCRHRSRACSDMMVSSLFTVTPPSPRFLKGGGGLSVVVMVVPSFYVLVFFVCSLKTKSAFKSLVAF